MVSSIFIALAASGISTGIIRRITGPNVLPWLIFAPRSAIRSTRGRRIRS